MTDSDDVCGQARGRARSQDRRLRLRRADTSRPAVVEISGEIDLTSVEEFDSCLCDAAAALDPGDRLIVDLSAVDFLAACGVRSLLQAERLAARRQGQMRLVAATEQVLMPLAVLGLLERLHVCASRSEAAA
ncbi:STAS domain-containing protein [Pseudonocardia halophobica]|uniref:STAS domain-containing protein n=1 Tax=Pseudonocardia halophobica TaxID=29401 RepID=UPI003D911E02